MGREGRHQSGQGRAAGFATKQQIQLFELLLADRDAARRKSPQKVVWRDAGEQTSSHPAEGSVGDMIMSLSARRL
jgi:hypothetical protein